MTPLKNPPPTTTECRNAYFILRDAIDSAYPVAATPPATYGGYPNPGPVYNAFSYEGVTEEKLIETMLLGLSYYGAPIAGDYAHNALVRTNAFVTGHDLITDLMAQSFAEGVPFPPASSVVVTPLVASFSQGELERRALLDPPVKYDGAVAYNAADAAIWRPLVVTSQLAMQADPEWHYLDNITQTIIAKNMAGKGLPYQIPGPLSQYAGLNAAQVLRIADPTTLPGVPATP
jgi:hypothetical protein